MALFDSKRVRLATIIGCWAIVLGAFVGWRWYEGSRADENVRRDRAAVEAAARTLTYDDIASSWNDLIVGEGGRFRDLHERVAGRFTAAHEEDGALVLVFKSGFASREVCIDLITRPSGNRVRSRDC